MPHHTHLTTTTTILLILTTLTIPLTTATPTPHHTTTLPPAFTWQNINGTDYTTPIKDQTPAPTCEGYALCAALETKIRYKTNATFTPDLSEAHIYFYPGGTIEQGYVSLNDAANYLMTTGVPDEGCFPDPHRPADFPYHSLPGWENRTVKIDNWTWIPHDNDTIKTHLINDGPLVVCLHLNTDFFYYLGGVYTPRWGTHAGGHVVCLVGYDDTHNCWILKNSWGTGWGDHGWFRISYTANLFSSWYGPGSGIMALGDVYGNLHPNAPTIQFTTPLNLKTYLFGHEIPTLAKKLPNIQWAAARFFGPATIAVSTENATSVSFYLDGNLTYTDTEAPYQWRLQATAGLHTLDAIASDGTNLSKDTIDIWTPTNLA
jgi:hypothetical protein